MLSYRSTGIKKMIFDRLCQIDEEIVETDPKYQKLGEDPGELLKQLAAKLSLEDNKLLNEYDDKYFFDQYLIEILTLSASIEPSRMEASDPWVWLK